MIEPKGLDKIIDRIEDIMNYYGTEKYKERMKMLDESIFSRIMFDEPEREKELESGYLVRYYYYADEENCKPGYAPVDGEICRLFKDDNLIFEWKNTDAMILTWMTLSLTVGIVTRLSARQSE